MFYRNENNVPVTDTKKQDNSINQNTQPVEDNINPVDSFTYDDGPFQCPFDMYRPNYDANVDPYQQMHHQQPNPHHPRPNPYPYYPHVYYIIHHHYYHNRRRPSDSNY